MTTIYVLFCFKISWQDGSSNWETIYNYRVEMKNKLQSMGIKVAGSVSKNTDFLVIGPMRAVA